MLTVEQYISQMKVSVKYAYLISTDDDALRLFKLDNTCVLCENS